jgi:gluconate 2-dehydrogenase gamma chain
MSKGQVVKDQVTRRHFLNSSSALAGSSILRLSLPASLALAETACTARDAGQEFRTLTNSEARELDAITARILPTTDTPGAAEAGVVYFLDTVLSDHFASQLNAFRALMQEFLADVEGQFGVSKTFADLSESDQDAFLIDNDKTPFFGMLQAFTMMGFFAMSTYGGNKDHIGWKLIGFEGHGATQPPFGYYDAQYMQGVQHEAQQSD